MRAPLVLMLVLSGPAILSAAPARQAVTPSVADAERAFADALASHDRAAFVALFAPDAESTLPSVKRGPEAIADAWLPFLIDPGTTMLLTSTGPATTDGNTASSSGKLAVRGRTNNGIQTVPIGTYTITWRLIDGRWKIGTLGSAAARPTAETTSQAAGVGAYRFGMTRAEVSGVPDCAPYTHVAVTGGLECERYRFDDREMNISFIFAAERLRRVQLWFYEGESSDDARQALERALVILRRSPGGLTIAARPDMPVTAEAIMSTLVNAPQPTGRQIASLEICATSTGPTRWFARAGRHEHGYMIMLFAEPQSP